MAYARSAEEKSRVLLALKDIYYYLNDEDAYVRVEETWAENHDKEDKFAAYMLLAQNAETPQVKAQFLEKALNEVRDRMKAFMPSIRIRCIYAANWRQFMSFREKKKKRCG